MTSLITARRRLGVYCVLWDDPDGFIAVVGSMGTMHRHQAGRRKNGDVEDFTHAAFEFRHDSWFDDEVNGLLRQHGCAVCIVDGDDGPQVPFTSTADWGYLRLRGQSYNDGELAEWRKRIAAQDWREAFVFFKHEDAGAGPALAKRFLASSQ